MAQQISRVAFVAIPYAGLYFWYFWDKPKVHQSFDDSPEVPPVTGFGLQKVPGDGGGVWW